MRKPTGNIQDFAVGAFDNEEIDELVAALIQEVGRVALVNEPKSALIVYEIKNLDKPEP